MKLQIIERYTLSIGLADKDTKTQLIETKDAIGMIQDVCKDCTIINNVNGAYTHDDGTPVKENTLLVQLLFKQENEVENYVETLKKLLNQESIAVTLDTVKSALL